MVHWDKVGMERLKAMMLRLDDVADELACFIGAEGKFVMRYNGELCRRTDFNPYPWKMKPFCSNDKEFHALVYEFLGKLQGKFSHEPAEKHMVQQLIDNPKLASYVLTQFFLNEGRYYLETDPTKIHCWRTIELKSGKEIHESAWLRGVKLGSYAQHFGSSEVYRDLLRELHCPTSLQLAKVSLEDLGFPGCATEQDIEWRVRDLGYFPCPSHLAPQLRREYKDQPDQEVLNILQGAVNVLWIGTDKQANYHAFQLMHYVKRAHGRKFLEVREANPYTVCEKSSQFVICLNDPYPSDRYAGMSETFEQLVARRRQAWLDAGGDRVRARAESQKQEAAVAMDPKSVERRTFDMSKDRLGLGGGAGSPNRPRKNVHSK